MPSQSPRMRKAFVLAREKGITDEERVEFAAEIINRDIESWSELDEHEVERVLDALHGVHVYGQLMAQRIRARVPSAP